jgi:hypothetical protein
VVKQIQGKISSHRKTIVPALIVLSLLSGAIVSILSTPNAQADYYKGCGYGYNSGAAGFGYGTGFATGYGYGLNGVFGYGYGNQVCPPPPTTTTTAGSGGGATTTTRPTTTTTAPTTTTTAPTTTTTTRRPPPRKVPALIFVKVLGPTTPVSVPHQFRCTSAATCHVVAKLEIPRPYIHGVRTPATREVVLSTEKFTLAKGHTGEITFYYNAEGRSVTALFIYHHFYHLSLVTTVTGGHRHVWWVPINK